MLNYFLFIWFLFFFFFYLFNDLQIRRNAKTKQKSKRKIMRRKITSQPQIIWNIVSNKRLFDWLNLFMCDDCVHDSTNWSIDITQKKKLNEIINWLKIIFMKMEKKRRKWNRVIDINVIHTNWRRLCFDDGDIFFRSDIFFFFWFSKTYSFVPGTKDYVGLLIHNKNHFLLCDWILARTRIQRKFFILLFCFFFFK